MKRKEDLKLGFIGAGGHAQANIYPSLKLLDVPLQAVCTQHQDKAEKIANEYQAKAAYNDYEKMLAKENLDAVFVITDNKSQAIITKTCLQVGINVFVEKPLGMNEMEAAEIAELSKKNDKQVMVGFMKRFAPSYLLMKEIMDKEDKFGKKMSFRSMFAFESGRPGWDNEVFLKMGGIHYVDLMRFLFGEVKEVKGLTNSENLLVDQIYTLQFENNIIGNIFFGGLPSWNRKWEEITVTGINGFVKVNNLVDVEYHYANPEIKADWKCLSMEDGLVTSQSATSSGGWRDLYLNGFVGELEHFFDCLISGKEPITSAFDNIKTMKLCDSFLAALK
jgi:UDP-N-acetylglucosamine 3-dehydrogenase